MPHSFGYRAHTRYLFRRDFRTNGPLKSSTFLNIYKTGQLVDIKGNGAVHKGMPHKYYHGRTGRVWNVTPRAIGVEIHKQVKNRIIPKRIHVRIEHVRPSKSNVEFLKRRKENDAKKRALKKGEKATGLKRTPGTPAAAQFIKAKANIETVAPVKYESLL